MLSSTAVSTYAAIHDTVAVDSDICSACVMADTVGYSAVAAVSGDAALYTARACGDAAR